MISPSGVLMNSEYLATGFRDIDQAQDKDVYFNCLTLLDSLPYYKECKAKSYDLLDLRPGLTVLEAGCGLGDDALRIAGRIAPGGKVIGVDASSAMIERARQQALAAHIPVEFLVADVRALPFPDDAFARVRIDRVLQHIFQPEKVIAELGRVLAAGGLLLAYDNDWKTFSIASSSPGVTRSLERLWRDSFVNSGIGRALHGHFLSAGLSQVTVHPGTSILTDFATADHIYNLQATVTKAVTAGLISEAQGRGWIEELMERSEKGIFAVELKAYMVVGKKFKIT